MRSAVYRVYKAPTIRVCLVSSNKEGVVVTLGKKITFDRL